MESIIFDFWSSTTSAETKLLLSNQVTTEKRSIIGGRLIFLREILIQTYIPLLQVIFGNILMYSVSVSNYPRSERSIFCILIVDVI